MREITGSLTVCLHRFCEEGLNFLIMSVEPKFLGSMAGEIKRFLSVEIFFSNLFSNLCLQGL
jgi:hypothetical protein